MNQEIRLAAERDGYRRVSEEAMKLMTPGQLLELARRLDLLDGNSFALEVVVDGDIPEGEAALRSAIDSIAITGLASA